MRAVPPALQARLDAGATTLCRCWQLERRDGIRLGFTDHDRDLEFDGLVHRAASGLTASAATAALGLGIDTQTIEGALQGAAIDEADIAAGRLDGALVRQFLVDWQDTSLRLLLGVGTLGAITRRGHAFEAEVLGLAAALNRPVGRAYLRTCDRVLGDGRCKVDLDDPAYRASATVAALEGSARVVLGGLGAFDAGWFEGGRLEWQDGAAAGLVSVVRHHALSDGMTVVETREDLPAGIGPGSVAVALAGCDKRLATCRDKFSNLANFRGFPHLPGDDWAAGYPQEGGRHDGGSLFEDRD